jgi:choice-of-anchor B domain-containing protein
MRTLPLAPRRDGVVFLAAAVALFAIAKPGLAGPSDDTAAPAGSGWLTGPYTAGYAGFGSAVALVGDRVFVGDPGDFAFFPMPPNRPGALSVFSVAGDGSWEELLSVSSPSGQVGDGFGRAVAASERWVVVGAPGVNDGVGAAFVYSRVRDDLLLSFTLEGDHAGAAFGAAVALSDNVLYVGAPGASDGAGLVQVVRLDAPYAAPVELRPAEPAAGGRFGASLSAEADRVLVGAPGPGPDAFGFAGPIQFLPGAAHLFRGAPDAMAEVVTFSPGSDTPAAAGWSVLLHGDDAFLGAPLAGQGAGEILHFRRTGEDWADATGLTTEVQGQAGLGMALAFSDGDLLAGAPFQDFAVVFSADSSGAFTESHRIQGEGGQSFFGASLAAEPGRAVAGAPGAALFEGVGYLLARAEGEWARVTDFTPEASGPDAITGEAVPCSPDGVAAAFPCSEVDLVAFIPVRDLGAERGIMVNDLWGWTDAETGREYAIVGRSDATVFVDVTDVANPSVLGTLPLSDAAVVSLWRDMKVYDHHAFIVADAAGAHGIQVFDLTQLRGLTPDSERVFTETARYDGIFSAHNIVINQDTGFAYVVGASMGGTTCGGGLHMVDIRDPSNPTFAGCFQDASTGLAGTGYSHDAQCVLYHGPDADYAGAEICLGANENALSIADVTDKENPVGISTARYPNSAYLHQGWVSEDHRYFFMNDEGDEIAGTAPRTRTLVWDIQDLDDPILVAEHLGTTAASDHNLYVSGNLMYQSNYVSGLRILDVSDPENPVEIGYFDTVPQGTDDPGFAGSWSNYPFFESGTILVTSMREGLFLLKRKERRAVL